MINLFKSSILFSLLSFCLIVSNAQKSSAQDAIQIPIAAQDVLMIRVAQWNPIESEFVAWGGLSGEYTVATDGTISLPIAGIVPTGAQPIEAIADDIAQRLTTRLGLTNLLSVSVEVLQYRPIYILGKVRDPGPYPYVPGLTVLQALGLASGVGIEDVVEMGATRRALNAVSEYEVLRVDQLRHQAAILRLRTELADASEITLPGELEGELDLQDILELEREILRSRNNALRASLEQIASLKDLLSKQISSMSEQITLVELQITNKEEELANVISLIEQGLATATRRGDLSNELADLATRKLQLETARLEAEQEVNTADREQQDLINTRRMLLLEELATHQSDLSEVEIRMRLMSALFSEANLGTRPPTEIVQLEPTFTITRKNGDEFVEISATKTTMLKPMDVLEVELPLFEGSGANSDWHGSLLEGFSTPVVTE